MSDDAELAGRVRAALADRATVREVSMFGGLSFMVDGRMVAAARADGELLLRVDPQRCDELVAAGARRAEMGGRLMSPAWLSIPPEALATDRRLADWLALALAFDPRSTS